AMATDRIVAIVGATATGKTALAEAVAEALDGEVVCADSRQVFRELEIGTGKPTPEQRARRPHHLFAALALGERASAGWYAGAAAAACAGIRARGRVPVLVGGSGLYLDAARRGLAPTPPHDRRVRERLRAALEREGPEALHRRLASADPESARRLAPRDAQRVTRALEVLETSGRPLSAWHATGRSGAIPGSWRILELTCPPRDLGPRIERRTRAMFDRGLLEETRALVAAGSGAALERLRAIGYDEALAVLAGRLGRAEAEARVNLRTRQLAKRQRTWFRHQVEAARLGAERAEAPALAAAALALVG
ncbi:MAG TPA: tRNA (adenosine(37)-N6)-dimethylallyltransferase MiaA, partial [Candidatus Eisenbacteria bacterium]